MQKVVDMTLDAMKTESLTEKRLFEWHKMLFSKNQSDCKTMSDDKTIIDGKIIKVGAYRDDEERVMQVVSIDGKGTEKVHYQAPAASRLEKEMDLFFNWLNDDQQIDPILKSGIAHFWFLSIHPMADGNGRISREMVLTKSYRSLNMQTYYSVSEAIGQNKSENYDI